MPRVPGSGGRGVSLLARFDDSIQFADSGSAVPAVTFPRKTMVCWHRPPGSSVMMPVLVPRCLVE